jgi:hypothetical protein
MLVPLILQVLQRVLSSLLFSKLHFLPAAPSEFCRLRRHGRHQHRRTHTPTRAGR